ncbi:MAG: arylesterase [Planctomycetota bacterium]|jgi:acyl-CoA thioesterase-1
MRILLLLVFLAACSDRDAPGPDELDAPSNIATTRAPEKLDIPKDAPKVAFLGDSLAAGLHLARDEAFPAVVQRTLYKRKLAFHVINAGVSGSTTAAGLARVDWVLGQKPDIVVVELGANDGFRAVPLKTIESNLEEIVKRIQKAGARPLVLGIILPPNYGVEYAKGFDSIFPRVAKATKVPVVARWMEGVGGEPGMNLPDGIHPTPQGHVRLARNLEDALAKELEALARD